MTSPFQQIPKHEWVAENELCFAIRDGYPVSKGHTLVITKRLVMTWADATKEERLAVMELTEEVREALILELNPDGFNIGVNVGVAAGQTVMHLHLHIIPRWAGDVDDPAGGVRFVIPERGNYREPGRVPLVRRDEESTHQNAGSLVGGELEDHLIHRVRSLLYKANSVE